MCVLLFMWSGKVFLLAGEYVVTCSSPDLHTLCVFVCAYSHITHKMVYSTCIHMQTILHTWCRYTHNTCTVQYMQIHILYVGTRYTLRSVSIRCTVRGVGITPLSACVSRSLYICDMKCRATGAEAFWLNISKYLTSTHFRLHPAAFFQLLHHQ